MAHIGSSDSACPSFLHVPGGSLDEGPTEGQQRSSTSCAIGPSNGSQAGEASLVMEQEVWIHQSCHITLCDAMQHGMTDATQR